MKWSPVSYRSSVEQEKFACQRSAFYYCATQPAMSQVKVLSKRLNISSQNTLHDIAYRDSSLMMAKNMIVRKLVPGRLSYGVVCVILHLAVLVQYRLVTDGRTGT